MPALRRATDCSWENDLIAGSRRDKRGVGSGQLQIEACTLPREFWGRLNAFVPLSPESDEQVAEVKPIKPEQIDALIPFLDKFEEAGFSAGDWKVVEGHLWWFNFDEIVMEFIQVLDDNDWVTPQFDWGEWQESATRYIESREMVESADAVTIQKLLTTHVRADRFCEGHLASMFENGHIVAVLRRLKVIRDGVE